jgi:hypothetical protein
MHLQTVDVYQSHGTLFTADFAQNPLRPANQALNRSPPPYLIICKSINWKISAILSGFTVTSFAQP